MQRTDGEEGNRLVIYTKMGTEYAAATLSEYKRRGLPLQVYATALMARRETDW
jgi:hypothetical protein